MWQLEEKPSKDIVKFRLTDIKFKMFQMRLPYKRNNLEYEKGLLYLCFINNRLIRYTRIYITSLLSIIKINVFSFTVIMLSMHLYKKLCPNHYVRIYLSINKIFENKFIY